MGDPVPGGGRRGLDSGKEVRVSGGGREGGRILIDASLLLYVDRALTDSTNLFVNFYTTFANKRIDSFLVRLPNPYAITMEPSFEERARERERE